MHQHVDLEPETLRRLHDHCRADRVDLALVVALNVLLEAFHHSQGKIMTALEDLNAKADALAAQVATNNADIEALIALAKSKGASDDEIAAVTAKLDASLQSLAAEDAAAAGALPPAA